jgi:hypothetical protein
MYLLYGDGQSLPPIGRKQKENIRPAMDRTDIHSKYRATF